MGPEINALRVKVGTMPAQMMRLVKRRPRRGIMPARRTAPDVGDYFYVAGAHGAVLSLRCTEIKPDLGPLYYAEKV